MIFMQFHSHDMQTELSSCSCLGARNKTRMVLHCVSGDKFSLVTCTLAKGVAEPSCSEPVENSIRTRSLQ